MDKDETSLGNIRLLCDSSTSKQTFNGDTYSQRGSLRAPLLRGLVFLKKIIITGASAKDSNIL
jgi:hypothetical protein